jgi:tRNA(fMet)-specific endonuclease VapC
MREALFLLDTNIVSQLMRKNPQVIQKILLCTPDHIAISAVTMGELLFGLAKRPGAHQLHSLVKEFIQRVEVLTIDTPVMETYGPLRARLEASGTILSPLDLLIASHALSLNLTLITNDGAFFQVPGLKVEDWTRDQR